MNLLFTPILFLLAVAALGCSDRTTTDPLATSRAPIVNGTPQLDADSLNRPVIYIREKAAAGGRRIGSGLLLTNRVVLLAAHEVCAHVRHPENLEVLLGNAPVSLFADVDHIVLHSKYVPGSNCGGHSKNQSGIDLALVFLQADLFPSQGGIIALASKPLPTTVRCESHYYHNAVPSIDRQNFAYFPVLGPEPGRPGYFSTNVNVALAQNIDRGDSGSPCFTQTGDSLVGIVSARRAVTNPMGRKGVIVDARRQSRWILGASTPRTHAAMDFDWDGDGVEELVRLESDDTSFHLIMDASATDTEVQVSLPLSRIPNKVQAAALGKFNSTDASLVLVGDGELSLVDLARSSQESFGQNYGQVIPRFLDPDAYEDLVAYRPDGTPDVYLGGEGGLEYQPQASVSFLDLDRDDVPEAVTIDGQSLRVASSRTDVPFSTMTLPFTNPELGQQVSGHFRRFTSEEDQSIEDLVVEEGGEVLYLTSNGTYGFGTSTWLHRPTTAHNAKVVEVDAVQFNDDDYDDLVMVFDDGTMKFYLGGSLGGLTESLTQTTNVIVGDITLDGCVDMDDWEIFEDSYGFPLGGGGDPRADLNGDGRIDDADYLEIAEHWGMGPGCVAVP